MKNYTLLALLAGWISSLPFKTCAQGNFQNLNFESATIVPINGDGYDRIQFATAFPGWTGYCGTNVQTLALYNNRFLDSSGLGLQTQGTYYGLFGYSASIQAGYALSGGYPDHSEDASLAQVGLVPVGAHSLQFIAQDFGGFQVSLGGQPLSITPLIVTSNYTLYGADISAFSGSVFEMRFTAFRAPPPGLPEGILLLDQIFFSANAVPEPSSLVLVALGVLIFAPLFSNPIRRR